MANIKISQLGAASTLMGTELIELVQGGTNVQSTISAIRLTASYAASASWASSSISASYYPIQLPDITDDTINHFVGINNSNPAYSLDVNGSINSRGDFYCLGNNTMNFDALGNFSIGIGASADTNGISAIAIGYGASTSDEQGSSIALGAGAQANNTNTIAIGTNAIASGNNSVAIGNDAIATGADCIVFGNNNVGINNSSPGYELDVNGSINFTGYLYRNGYQLYPAITNQQLSNLVGINQSNPAYTLDVGGDINLFGSIYHNTNKVMGFDDTNNSIAICKGAYSIGNNALAIGFYCAAYGNNAIALGPLSYTEKPYSTALGPFSYAGGNFSTAIGYNASAKADYSTAIGYNAYANADYSTAIGYYAYANATNSVVIGSDNTSPFGAYPLNVGINNSSPAYSLDVSGDINFTGNLKTNGTSGISVTIPYQKTLTTTGTLVFTNGILTSHT